MKIALCLMGIVGSTDGKYGVGRSIDPRIGHWLHDKHIFKANPDCQVDTFIHSWSTDFKDILLDLYKPKKYIIENQIDFKQGNLRGNSIKSRWYSTKKAIELKSLYESETNSEYDFVMIYRLDCGFTTDLVFKNFNNNNFYASHRSDCTPSFCKCEVTKEFYDTWFFSNSKNMDIFGSLYDNWGKYGIANPHKECVHHIYYTGLSKNLQHVFYELKDHNNVRAMFENCHYNPNEEFNINKLVEFSSYPRHRFTRQNDKLK
jgi:hypothetical protein